MTLRERIARGPATTAEPVRAVQETPAPKSSFPSRACRSTYGGARFDNGRAVRCDGRVSVGWADGSRGTCSMVATVGTHGNGSAARYWED